jgi:tetratricopeptide (TPR) repeat protein
MASAGGYIQGIATATGNLAVMALNRKEWLEAETLARGALAWSEKIGRQDLIASDCRHLAKALARQGRKEEALPYAQRALEVRTWLGVRSDIEDARATLQECKVDCMIQSSK